MDAISQFSAGLRQRLERLAPVCLVIGLMTGLFVIGQAHASEDEPAGYNLVVRPSICVSYDSEIPCEMAMQISWEGANPADVCLKESRQEPDIQCWENARTGTVDVTYTDTSDVLYQLVEESSSFVLAEAEVIIINRDLRSARKRRRHVWSIL